MGGAEEMKKLRLFIFHYSVTFHFFNNRNHGGLKETAHRGLGEFLVGRIIMLFIEHLQTQLMMVELGTTNNYFRHIKNSTSLKRNYFNKIQILLIGKKSAQ